MFFLAEDHHDIYISSSALCEEAVGSLSGEVLNISRLIGPGKKLTYLIVLENPSTVVHAATQAGVNVFVDDPVPVSRTQIIRRPCELFPERPQPFSCLRPRNARLSLLPRRPITLIYSLSMIPYS